MKHNFITKLLLALLLSFVCIPTNIYAEESNDIGIYPGSEIYELYNDDVFAQPLEHNIMLANSINNNARASATLNIPRITQYDSRWANNTLNGCSSETIRSAGCALVSMTMVYNYLKGKSSTPAEINNKYVVCSMNWSNVSSYLGFRISSGGLVNITNSNAYSNIKPYLDNGNPVIVKVTKGGGMHWMVAYGYNSSGNTIYVRDPDQTNFTSLANAANNGWNVEKMIAFSN